MLIALGYVRLLENPSYPLVLAYVFKVLVRHPGVIDRWIDLGGWGHRRTQERGWIGERVNTLSYVSGPSVREAKQ